MSGVEAMSGAEPKPRGRIVLAGGTGTLGRSLGAFIHERARGDADIVILSRTEPPPGPWRHARWDGRNIGDWARELDGASALVNLCGRRFDCVKTPLTRDQIIRSRVEPTLALGRAIRAVASPPGAWVQMSGTGCYGDGREACDESSPFGVGFAPDVCRRWEGAFAEACTPDIRPVVLRASFVLGRSGGAYPLLRRIARLGLGGRVGDGRQGMSWIHELDMHRLLVRAITDASMHGPYTASAPAPASNRAFMRELRRSLRVSIGIPAARWMVRLGAPLALGIDPELALEGRFCISRRLAQEGFAFRFPELAPALADLR